MSIGDIGSDAYVAEDCGSVRTGVSWAVTRSIQCLRFVVLASVPAVAMLLD